jgi:adenylate cyclase
LSDTSALELKALFEAEMLVSEHLRLRAMLGLFIVISLNISVALLVFPEVVATFFEGSLDPFVVLPITYSYLLYAIAAYVSLTKSLSKNTVPNKLWGYTGALVESSIPTLLTYALGTIQAPSTSLFLPPLFLYFVFIALSALRLDQKLVWFAGICCSMQYLALSYYSTDGFRVSAELPQILTAPQHHVAKSIVLLLTTLAIALVVTELRKRLLNSLIQAEQQQKILNLFGQHVSPQVAARLTSDEDAGASRSESASILFFDIRGFTAFAEKREPEAVVTYLNTVFESLIETVNRHNGFVNKFLGDGFMAVFVSADGEDKHCRNALLAAIEISEQVRCLVSVFTPAKS